ncbi:hypothetical protein [uncultured Psychrobacillus sp.]|uniref:hypothetical protein n=1 Tax=uncultured Psychrobacillus sp. TaxID=1551585 RepID=UPI0026277845|nr:hypothetical protein [uncultured Psychrobacillus sp.]
MFIKILFLKWGNYNRILCILQKSEQFLHFDKAEHIIPAGLGGIQKLEKGSVSDEANEKFSKTETVALRNSFIAFNRLNFGLISPVMRLLRQEENKGAEFLLGFIFAGQSYIIPQLILDFNDKENTLLPMVYGYNFK